MLSVISSPRFLHITDRPFFHKKNVKLTFRKMNTKKTKKSRKYCASKNNNDSVFDDDFKEVDNSFDHMNTLDHYMEEGIDFEYVDFDDEDAETPPKNEYESVSVSLNSIFEQKENSEAMVEVNETANMKPLFEKDINLNDPFVVFQENVKDFYHRCRILLTLGGILPLIFLPFVLGIIVTFIITYSVFGIDFIHRGSI